MMYEPQPHPIPVLPLRDIVVFPSVIVPLFVGREKSIRALDAALANDKKIFLVTQKEAAQDQPVQDDLHQVGVTATILQLLKLPDGTVKVLAESSAKARLLHFTPNEEFFEAYVEELIPSDIDDDTIELEALMRTMLEKFEQYARLNKKVNPDVASVLMQMTDVEKVTDLVSSHLQVKIHEKQQILEIDDLHERMRSLINLIESEIGVINTEKKIRSDVDTQMREAQRQYYLNEQMKAIQKELGEGEDGKTEVAELEKKIKKVKLSKEAREKAEQELKKLKMMNAMSSEASVVRNYLDWIVGLPWGKLAPSKLDLKKAESILDADHYGMEKVKERILEYLAVLKRTKKMRGSIICLVGPPGVGKTSLARSIAASMEVPFVRVSLGGVHDESEIRGHRRTYIGAMPGKIIQSLKKSKYNNPLMLLDEIDKLGNDYHRGDPSSAMLEVLDMEQNSAFMDHYLEVEYDLSNVTFIATANSLNMPRPLLDRLEVIRLSGYTEDEKVAIAKRHLLPKQEELHGVKDGEAKISDNAIRDVIRHYTREAGVRNLERELASLLRKAVKKITVEGKKTISITAKNLKDFAGVQRFLYGEAEKLDLVGITNGLAYTEVGGELLLIEGVSLPGKGDIKATGKLGDVMQESAQAAFSFIKSKSLDYGITPPEYQKRDVHIHVPEGATPKDGPSAGVAMCTSIVSALSQIPVKSSVAMTGEVTLRGRVLAIGGLKEKLLAALRAGIKTVLIPKENSKDLVEIPDNIKNNLEIIPVESVDEVLKHALVKPVKPVEWSEPLPIASNEQAKVKSAPRTTH